jgi:hypothetical protein
MAKGNDWRRGVTGCQRRWAAAIKRQAAACLFLHNMFLETKSRDRSKKIRKTGGKLRE